MVSMKPAMILLILTTLSYHARCFAGALSPDDAIRQARVLLQRKQFREAVDLLIPVVKKDSALDAHLLLGVAFQGARENDRAFDAFARCLQVDATDDRARVALRDLLREGFPRMTTTETIETIRTAMFGGSWTRKEFDIRLSPPPNDAAADRRAFITSGLLYTPVVPRRDPLRMSVPLASLSRSYYFNRICYGYLFEPRANVWRQRCRISFVSESLSSRDFQPLIEEIGRAFMQACVIAEDRFGLTPRYTTDGVADIWVTNAGPPRAEQSAVAPGHIFFYSSATSRSGAEWLREVFHEYGHLVLPPIDGFIKAEEPFVSGLIGETLLLPVIEQTSDTLAFEASRGDLRTLLEKRMKKSTGLFLQEGPESRLIEDTTDAGMAYAASFVRFIADIYGAEGVVGMFALLPATTITRTEDLVRAHETWLRSHEHPSVRIDTMLQEGGATRSWVYMPWPTVDMTLSAVSGTPAAAVVSLKGGSSIREGIVIEAGQQKDVQVSLKGIKPGWYAFSVELKASSGPVRIISAAFRNAAPR